MHLLLLSKLPYFSIFEDNRFALMSLYHVVRVSMYRSTYTCLTHLFSSLFYGDGALSWLVLMNAKRIGKEFRRYKKPVTICEWKSSFWIQTAQIKTMMIVFQEREWRKYSKCDYRKKLENAILYHRDVFITVLLKKYHCWLCSYHHLEYEHTYKSFKYVCA